MFQKLIDLSIPEEAFEFRNTDELGSYLESLPGIDPTVIGRSRSGQELYGVELGSGNRNVSVIAGCHADEPLGPMTAQALPILLSENFPELLDRFRFRIVPQMNPDGADRNRAWFRRDIHIDAYLRHVYRELPGDDIEFGFGDASESRPECVAAQEFLRPHAPLAAHFSLHGMAWAEGAWCLIHPRWKDRSAPFRAEFLRLCAALRVPLHDVERHGEKGFERIEPGFCTTPNSVAMRHFFLDRNDETTAAKFRPSSMEWISSLGGDPLCLVTELPLFVIGKRSPSLDDPISEKLKQDLAALHTGTMSLDEVVDRFDLRPMSLAEQMRLQLSMIVLSLQLIDK